MADENSEPRAHDMSCAAWGQEAEMVIASLPVNQPRDYDAVFGGLPDMRSELGVYLE